MVQITYTLRLDMRDTGIVNTSLRLKQGDSGMKIAVNVFNGGVSAFDSSTTPKIVFRRPDGASVMADMTVESSLYSYTLVGNELQVPGKELIDIKFPIGAEGRESTMSCSIEVVPDTITPNTHGSGIYDNDLAELVEEATEAAETVQEVVGDSEAWANGERNGVPVGPEDPAYHNNSKYWSEQANPTMLANLTDVDVDGVANGDALQYNSSTQKWEGKSISSGTNEIIAPVEGATSLHAYAVGKQLIYNDTLYKVIAPIAVNDALVVDTNIEVSPKTVIEQVEDLDANKMSYAVNTVLGAHNLSPFNPYVGTISGTTLTNVGSGTVRLNATSTTGIAWFNIVAPTSNPSAASDYVITLKKGSYKLVVNSNQALSSNVQVGLFSPTAVQIIPNLTSGTHNEVTFTLSADTLIFLGVRVADGGISVTNFDVQAFVILADDTDPTYAPHAMTNGELTKKAFIDRGALASTDNLNNITDEGIYHITTTPTNAPENAAWCTLIVSKRSSTDIQQFIIGSGESPFTYYRSYGGSTPHWYAWKKSVPNSIEPLTSSNNLNSIQSTGLYCIRDSVPSNSPENSGWCSLLVNKVADNNIQQQIFKGSVIYQRTYGGATPTWGSWYKFTGTVVS